MTAAEQQKTTLGIDRDEVLGAVTDLEHVPLALEIEACAVDRHGTTIEMTGLNKDLLAPREEPLRAMLFYEYGRASGMQILVNGSALTFDDALGPSHRAVQSFEGTGDVQLRFSIAEKRPRYAGFVVKVGGKAIGKPTFLGLDEDPEVPPSVGNIT